MTSSMHKLCMSFAISIPLIGSPMTRWLASSRRTCLSSRRMIWNRWYATASGFLKGRKKMRESGWTALRFSRCCMSIIRCWWVIWAPRFASDSRSSWWVARWSIPRRGRLISSLNSSRNRGGLVSDFAGCFFYRWFLRFRVYTIWVKSGEEWWRVVKSWANSSPLGNALFIGISEGWVKSEEYFMTPLFIQISESEILGRWSCALISYGWFYCAVWTANWQIWRQLAVLGKTVNCSGSAS